MIFDICESRIVLSNSVKHWVQEHLFPELWNGVTQITMNNMDSVIAAAQMGS